MVNVRRGEPGFEEMDPCLELLFGGGLGFGEVGLCGRGGERAVVEGRSEDSAEGGGEGTAEDDGCHWWWWWWWN